MLTAAAGILGTISLITAGESYAFDLFAGNLTVEKIVVDVALDKTQIFKNPVGDKIYDEVIKEGINIIDRN